MSEPAIILFLTLYAITALGLSVLTCVRIARQRSRSGALLILVLRLIMLTLVGVLAWQIFGNFDRKSSSDGPEAAQTLLVLQDRSASMDFRSGEGTRHDQAQAIVARLETLVAEHETPLEMERLFFAGNVVPEKLADQLRADSTQLALALRHAFGLFRPQALLVISDGAATDGPPPPFLIDWARNRHIPIFAVGTGDDRKTDLVVETFTVSRTNPTQLQARISSYGPAKEAMKVQLRIDDRIVERREIAPSPEQMLRFDMPEVEEGWHSAAVEIQALADEVSLRNNKQLAVFQVVAPQRLLIVYDSPNLETRHLARYLRQLHGPERVQTLPADSPELRGLRPENYLLTIISDVAPRRLPTEFMRLLQRGQLRFLLLSGRNLGKWPSAGLPDFPVKRYVGPGNLAKEEDPAARVGVATGNQQAEFRRLRFDALRLNNFDRVKLTKSAKTMFHLQSGRQTWPLLVCDKQQNPRQLVLLSNTTWRWGLHPERRVRSDYNAFWRVLMDWLVGSPGQDSELRLAFVDNENDPPVLRTKITHQDAKATPALRDVQLDIQHRDQNVRLAAGITDSGWEVDWRDSLERPAIVWFQAHAAAATRQVKSPKRPRLLPVESRELLETRTHPEILRAIVSDPDRNYAPADDADRVLRRMLQGLEQPAEELLIRRRNPLRELILATVIVLLISMEWLFERNLKERRN